MPVGGGLGTVGVTAGAVAGLGAGVVAGDVGESVVVEGVVLPGIGTTGASAGDDGGSGFLNGSSQVWRT